MCLMSHSLPVPSCTRNCPSLTVSPTNFIDPVFVPPLNIQAWVDLYKKKSLNGMVYLCRIIGIPMIDKQACCFLIVTFALLLKINEFLEITLSTSFELPGSQNKTFFKYLFLSSLHLEVLCPTNYT